MVKVLAKLRFEKAVQVNLFSLADFFLLRKDFEDFFDLKFPSAMQIKDLDKYCKNRMDKLSDVQAFLF